VLLLLRSGAFVHPQAIGEYFFCSIGKYGIE